MTESHFKNIEPPEGYVPADISQFAALPKLSESQRKRIEVKTKRKDAVKKRFALHADFVDRGMAGLQLSDIAVWVTLFRHANADGVACVPRTRIEAVTGCRTRTVTVALQRLIKSGWLARIRRGGPVGGVAKYQLQAPPKGGLMKTHRWVNKDIA